MQFSTPKQLSDFYVAGINYRKADAALRGQFAVNEDQYLSILSKAKEFGINELFILSTCNRTEIYGFAADAKMLSALLCSETNASIETFYQSAYIKQGKQAVEHLYHVAAGLDSQILGDYEIVGQLKNAAKLAKSHGFIGASLERTLNAVLQTSKAVKNNTHFSTKAASVAYAAVQWIKENFATKENINILFLSTVSKGKGIYDAVRGYEIVKENFNNVTLTLCGNWSQN